MLQPLSGSIASLLDVAASPQGVGLLVTAALLGIRHGIDWDHIAAITDITSTTATADAGTAAHGEQHRALAEIVDGHEHEHGGRSEMHAHDLGPGAATLAADPIAMPPSKSARLGSEQRHAITLGSLYALRHASVVAEQNQGAGRSDLARHGTARGPQGLRRLRRGLRRGRA